MAPGAMYRRLFWPVLAPSMLIGVAAGATMPIQVLAALQLGASPALASLMMAILGALALATTVHAGRAVDALGDRAAMLWATVAVSVLTLGVITALVWAGPGALWLFMVSACLRAPAMNVWSLARQAYVADRLPTREIGQAMTALGGTMRAGNLVGPVLGGALLLALPLWSVYVLSIVCSVLAVLIMYSRVGAEIDTVGGGPDGSSGPTAAPGGDQSPTRGRRAPLDVRWRAVVLAGVAIVTLTVARVGQPVLIPLWGDANGLSESTISFIVATGALVEIALMFPGGYLKDRLGRAPILIACLVVYGSGFLLLWPFTTWWATPGMVAAVVVMAIGNGLGAGVNMTIGADLSPRVGRGRFLGIWALFSNVGILGGPLLVSVMVAVTTLPLALVATGSVALLGAAWMAVFARAIGLPRGLHRS